MSEPAGWVDVRGLEPGYGFRRSGGHIPQSLPRDAPGGMREGGGLWTSIALPGIATIAAQ